MPKKHRAKQRYAIERALRIGRRADTTGAVVGPDVTLIAGEIDECVHVKQRELRYYSLEDGDRVAMSFSPGESISAVFAAIGRDRTQRALREAQKADAVIGRYFKETHPYHHDTSTYIAVTDVVPNESSGPAIEGHGIAFTDNILQAVRISKTRIQFRRIHEWTEISEDEWLEAVARARQFFDAVNAIE
jgi:hypothetical protein